MMKTVLAIVALLAAVIGNYGITYAHCDTEDGPVIKDARLALENNNVNYVLKWVPAADEKELKEAYDLTMKVRNLSPEAMRLADRNFFETLVRIHRSGEGVAFTGVKPAGAPIDEKILAADRSIEEGNLKPLERYTPQSKKAEIKKRFNKVMKLKNFDVNDVKAGREFVEAYVQFFHLAEGEAEEMHNKHLEGGCGHKEAHE
ncbi:MAG: DUF6448 family protein [Chloroflexota bacterium]